MCRIKNRRLLSTRAARDFPRVDFGAPITVECVMGTFVGYLLDRHTYMHVLSMQGLLSLI